MGSIKDSLTFDDVSLIPQESSVVPNETITKITLHKRLNLQIPLISSAMDTVTESKMAIAIAKMGGIGVIHRNLSVDAQVSEIKKVKKANFVVGAAIGVDIFGVASVASDDSGIGQILEDMALWVDYICTMIYPSTWSKGWFGLDYPAAYPEEVTFASVGSVVERLREIPTVRTRPWLQGFHDYGVRGVFYESAEVEAQIEGSTRAGGTGFMVWDARLRFPMNDLVRWFSNSHERKID